MSTNTTTFAGHYLAATTLFLDALAGPSGRAFIDAYQSAEAAVSAAYGLAELHVALDLVQSIKNAAQRSGYHAGCCAVSSTPCELAWT